MEIGLELSNAGRVMLWCALDRELSTVGSNTDCDICIPNDALPPVHMVLRLRGRELTLLNRNPRGTQIGETNVMEEAPLADGDVITLGSVLATVRFVTRAERAGKTRTLLQEAAAERTFVVSVPELLPGRSWEVTAQGITVGGAASNDIELDDPYLSSFHAQLNVQNGRCFVRDLDSRNGVFIDDQKVREAEVPDGGQVRLGKCILLVRTREEGSKPLATTATRMIGSSQEMEKVRTLLRRLAGHDAPVLITGETGTGKEVAARLLRELSPRAEKAYQTINCGALGKNLIESELFGHEKGAFTGATNRKAGAFEVADGGTLFLDEIGELPLDLQVSLLRVVEYGEVRRVGSTDTFRVDVRLIAATNRRLEAEVAAGTFREDLFHRLHVLIIELPALRQRKEDIPELARHFVRELTPNEPVRLSDAAIMRLIEHAWPGNVRELRNVLQRAVLMRATDVIAADEINFSPSSLHTRLETRIATSGRTLVEIEREAILSELVRHGGNRKAAAEALGISRSKIHRKIEEYDLDVEKLLEGSRR